MGIWQQVPCSRHRTAVGIRSDYQESFISSPDGVPLIHLSFEILAGCCWPCGSHGRANTSNGSWGTDVPISDFVSFSGYEPTAINPAALMTSWGEEAGLALLNYLQGFKMARLLPLAGIYDHGRGKWERVKKLSSD